MLLCQTGEDDQGGRSADQGGGVQIKGKGADRKYLLHKPKGVITEKSYFKCSSSICTQRTVCNKHL